MSSNPTEQQPINKLNNLSVCPTCPIKVQTAVILPQNPPKLRIGLKNLSAKHTVHGLSLTIVYHLTEHRSARSRVHIKNAVLEPSQSRACAIPMSYDEAEIVSYEVLVSQITQENGNTIEYGADDYVAAAPTAPKSTAPKAAEKAPQAHKAVAQSNKTASKDSPEKKKKLYTVVAVIGGLLILECIAGVLIAYRLLIYPKEKLTREYENCLADKRFDDALALAEENSDSEMYDSITLQAADYYFGENSIPEAVKYADMLENFDQSEYYDEIFTYYTENDQPLEGLSYAEAHFDDDEILPYVREFYGNAVAYSIHTLDSETVVALANHAVSAQPDKVDFTSIFTETAREALSEADTADEFEMNLMLHKQLPEYVSLPEETVQAAVSLYSILHDYDSALEFASYSADSNTLKNTILDAAVSYYQAPETMDEEKLLRYAIQLDGEKSSDVIRQAIDYFTAKWENDTSSDPFAYRSEIESCEENAPDEIKTEIQIKAKTVYLKMYERAGKSSFAEMLTTLKQLSSISPEAAQEFVNGLSISYITACYPDLAPYLSAETKRQLLASPVGVFKYCVGISENGASVGETELGWTDLASLNVSEHAIVGLTTSGTVLTHGDGISGEADTVSWSNIVDVGVGLYHTVGLLADGTVVASGSNENGQCNVSNLRNIVDIAVGNEHTVCLRSDGSVAAVGLNSSGQCEVSSWTDIIAVAAGTYHTVGLKSDGTVVCAGSTFLDKCAVDSWSDIVAISAGDCMTVGLKSNGTVVVTGRPLSGSVEGTEKLTNIRGIYAGSVCILGLKDDGSVVAAGDGAPNVSKLTGLRLNIDPRR